MSFPCRILEILFFLIESYDLASKLFFFSLQGDDQGVEDHEVCFCFLCLANCNFCSDKKQQGVNTDWIREKNSVTFQIPFLEKSCLKRRSNRI